MGSVYLPRAIEGRLKDLFRTFPVVVVTGARQVGKSTLLTHSFPKIPRVVLDPTVDIENSRADPELFLRNRPAPLILDEIQYAPELVAAIKRSLDEDRRAGQYLLTGSQQWGVMKALAESLAGRAVFLDLEAFSSTEIAGVESSRSWIIAWLNSKGGLKPDQLTEMPLPRPLYEQMWRGFLPETHFLKEDEIPVFHISYLRTYIERDVRLFSDIADLQLFSRFFKLCGALTGQEINHSEMGREIGLAPQTAARWLGILKATFQWYEIPAYSGNTIKRISQRPKGYLADVGLASAALAISTPEALSSHPQWGNLFETLLINDLRKQLGIMKSPPNLYHWRSHGGAEVDLLLERDGIFFPLEMKAASRPARGASRGIAEFRATYPKLRIAHGLIVAPAPRPFFITDDCLVVPWDALTSPS